MFEVLIAITASLVLIVNFYRSLRDGPRWLAEPNEPEQALEPHTSASLEPAYRQYFFQKGWHDFRLITLDTYSRTRGMLESISAGILTLSKAGSKFGYLIAFFLLAFFLIASAGSMVFGVGLFLAYLSLMLLGTGISATGAFLFRAIESISLVTRRIFFACPDYHKFPLPTYICPRCGAKHRSLLPGKYGVFSRRCQCGYHLPTLFLFGRSHLPAICPVETCEAPLNRRIGRVRNIHIPIVGGPLAGKTSFLMGQMVALTRYAREGVLGLHIDDQYRYEFESAHAAFERGEPPRKTAEQSPNAVLMDLTDKDGKSQLLYLYDPAGELYLHRETLHGHYYFGYLHGMMFLIDPFSIEVVQDYMGAGAVLDAVKPSAEAPEAVYTRMVQTLREHGANASTPLAVVLTKTDALTATTRPLPPPGDVEDTSDDPSAQVRQWLIDQGEDNLVRLIEHDFKTIRYFAASALGRNPSEETAEPFVPQRILTPLAWLLKRYGYAIPAS